MEKIKARAATTHLDRHGERLSLSALEQMCEQTNNSIMSMYYEHDYRNPPIGRWFGAEIVSLEDGEYALDIIGEVFSGNKNDFEDLSSKSLIVERCDDNQFYIAADRNYRNPEDEKLLNELDKIFLDPQPRKEEIKKSLEPISTLTIIGSFVAGAIASGFFGKIGSDLYDKLKEKLTQLTTPKKGEKEKLLEYCFTIKDISGNEIVARIIMTNPMTSDIDAVMQNGLKQLDEVMPILFEMNNKDNVHKIVKVVFDFKDGCLVMNYAITDKGLPCKVKLFKQHANK